MNELQSCTGCEYLLQLPTGAVCNGLKEPTVNPNQGNDCSSWARLDRETAAERNRELQERVQRPEKNRSRAIGDPIYIDDPAIEHISEEQIASLRNWASESIRRREERIFMEQLRIRPEPLRPDLHSDMPELTLTKLQQIMRELPAPENWWRCSGGSQYQVRICPPVSALSWSIDRSMPQSINYKTVIFQVRYREGRYCWVYEGEVIIE